MLSPLARACLLLVLLASGCPNGGSNPASSANMAIDPSQAPAHPVDGEDLKIQEALAAARQTVQTFIDAVKTQDRRAKMFKAEFVAEDGSREHMWVKDVRVEDGALVGVLDNEPTKDQSIKVGDEVRRDPGEITDWMIVDEGKVTGGFTIRAIRNSMTEADRKEFDAYSDYTFD